MQLNEQQSQFIEFLGNAAGKVDNFVEKIMGPMVEAYGSACLAPSKLPLNYVLDLAHLYLRLENIRRCEDCRAALGVDSDGPVRTATQKASRILTLAALQFCRYEAGGEGTWLPQDLREAMAAAEADKSRHDAEQMFQEVIHEAATRYLIRTVYEAALRLTELHYEQSRAFPAPLLARGSGLLAYAPISPSDELQQQLSLAKDIVSSHFAEQAREDIEIGGGGNFRTGPGQHYH